MFYSTQSVPHYQLSRQAEQRYSQLEAVRERRALTKRKPRTRVR